MEFNREGVGDTLDYIFSNVLASTSFCLDNETITYYLVIMFKRFRKDFFQEYIGRTFHPEKLQENM